MIARGSASVLWGALVLVACSPPAAPVKEPPPAAGPGVTFTWPRPGQRDVPLRAPIVVHFSDPLLVTPVNDCATAFCLEGPQGAVAGAISVAGA